MRAFGTIALRLTLLMAVPAAAAGPDLNTEEQKTVYAIGLRIAQTLGMFVLTPAETELVSAGLRDGLANAPKVDLGEYSAKVNELAQKRARRSPKPKRRKQRRSSRRSARKKVLKKRLQA